MILPGATLGVLGGGQLGRMFAVQARTMGYRVVVLDPDPTSPAAAVADEHLCAAYDDRDALALLGTRCDAVTTEFENVPAATLRALEQYCVVRPPVGAVTIAQDRISEKTFLRTHGVPVAPWAPVRDFRDLEDATAATGVPAILKTSRLGYDGKGQAVIDSRDAASRAFAAFGGVECVLERRLALECELSVVLARGVDGALASFPPAENVHHDGILFTSSVPAMVAAELAEGAVTIACRVAHALEYVGVLAVELFVADGGVLYVNEIAPRPHNSGHYTLDACVADQFEQQVRALCGLPLGAPTLLSPVVMINLLGDVWSGGPPRWEKALEVPGVKLHLYGKAEPRPQRKMGHLNCLAPSVAEAYRLATGALAALRRSTTDVYPIPEVPLP